MEVKFTKDFKKRYKKSPVKIRKAFDVRLKKFVDNPHSPVLRNHKLTGRFLGYRSINITGDWRAVYKEKADAVHFVELGTHGQCQLYE